MQYSNQQNFQQYQTYNIDPSQIKRANDINLIKKKSSGLGFYILTYFFAMSIAITGILIATEIFLLLIGGYSDVEQITDDILCGPFYHYMTIFASVTSATIPGFIYLKLSKNHIADCLQVKSVKPLMLIALTLMGMGVAMVANEAADMVAQNFSFLGFDYSLDIDSSSPSLYNNILYVISTAVTPAFAEEFAFRGILMGTLRKYGDSFAIITSAVMFGAMHGNIIQIPFAFILGLVFGYIDCKANSIIPSIIIHFVNNFYSVIMDILSSQSILTTRNFYILYYGIFVAMLILGVLAFLYIMKKDKSYLSISDTSSIVSIPLKDKMVSFFTSSGVIIVLIVLGLETLITLVAI